MAIINNNEDENLFFCSGDLPSLKAMGVLGKSNQVLSLEKVLEGLGLKRNLKHHFTENLKDKEIRKAYIEKDMYLK